MEAKLATLAEKDRLRGRWKLTDAKAHFSEVVKLAQKHPQRITLGGKDAVVVVAAATYDKEHANQTGEQLVKAFQHPLVADLDFARQPIEASVRDIEL